MSIILKNARAALEYGFAPAFPKSTYIDAINKRAAAIQAPGETVEKAFTRCIVDDEIGKLLYQVSKRAAGPEIEDDDVRDDVKPMKFSDLGPAHAKLEVLARDHRMAHPAMSIEGARSAVYTNQANADLREQIKQEHFARLTGNGAAGDDEDEQEASNRFADEQARAYPGNRGDIKGPRDNAPVVDKRVVNLRR